VNNQDGSTTITYTLTGSQYNGRLAVMTSGLVLRDNGPQTSRDGRTQTIHNHSVPDGSLLPRKHDMKREGCDVLRRSP
jgi:hypothetical protein